MPPVLLAIPAAAALAWWLLKGGPVRRRRTAAPFAGDVDGALEPGATRRLGPGEEEEPFRRRELPLEREDAYPSYTGGEYGGGYGPTSGPGGDGDGDGGAEAPAPTQTQTLASYDYVRSLFAAAPTQAVGVDYTRQLIASAPTTLQTPYTPPSGTQTAVKIPTSLLTQPAPAPAPVSSGGKFIAI